MPPELITKKVFYSCSRVNKKVIVEETYIKLGGLAVVKQFHEVSCEDISNRCAGSDCQFAGAGKSGNYIGKLY